MYRMSNQKQYWLYVLKLTDNKFYVGVTSKDPEERYEQHRNGYLAARWTKLYKPIKIEQVLDLGVITYEKAQLGENWATRKYIEAHGLDNVRGGDLTDPRKMVYKFKYYWVKEDWVDIKMMIYMFTILLFSMAYIVSDLVRRAQ